MDSIDDPTSLWAKKRALVRNVAVFSVAVVLIAVSAIVIFVTLGGKISFGK